MGTTVNILKATHKAAANLLGQIESSTGQGKVDTLNTLKEALLAHVGEENRIVKEAMGKPNATESFKSSAQNFVNELDALAKKALLPFFNKYSSASLVNSPDFSKDLQGIKKALADRIAYEESNFYPELEKAGY